MLLSLSSIKITSYMHTKHMYTIHSILYVSVLSNKYIFFSIIQNFLLIILYIFSFIVKYFYGKK